MSEGNGSTHALGGEPWPKLPSPIADGLVAGIVAAAIAGAPSILHAVAVRGEPLAASAAAGSLLLPSETRTTRLLVAAAPVHLFVSLGWAVVLSFLLPRRATPTWGALAGLAIAGFDLGVVGRRYLRIRRCRRFPKSRTTSRTGSWSGR